MVRRRYAGLDGLRGAAALLVLLTHVTRKEENGGLFSHGTLGVDIFFMISGFVISDVYGNRLASRELSIPSFMITRIIRLYPMILCGVIFSLIAACVESEPNIRLFPYLILQALIIPSFWTSLAFPLNIPQWSLFFEIAGNLFHSMLARIGNIRIILMLIIMISVVGLAGSIYYVGSCSFGFGGRGFYPGVFRLAFGYCAGIVIQRIFKLADPRPINACWIAIPIAVACALIVNVPGTAGAIGDIICVLIIFPTLTYLAANAKEHWLIGAIASLAGAISYPLYIIQMPVLQMMEHFERTNGTGHSTRYILQIVVCIALATFIELAIDAPLRQRLRRLTDLKNMSRDHPATAP